jgi:hypothetical protein
MELHDRETLQKNSWTDNGRLSVQLGCRDQNHRSVTAVVVSHTSHTALSLGTRGLRRYTLRPRVCVLADRTILHL